MVRSGPPASPVLLNLINMLYQAQDEIPGGTAGAVRNELTTGEYINVGHIQKAGEMITAIDRVIATGQLNDADLRIAQAIVADLKSSLGR